MDGSGDGGVAFCDLPMVPPGPAGKFVLAIMAVVAELEAGLISARTKAALAEAKKRGVKLGNPRLRKAGGGKRQHTAIANAAQIRKAGERAASVQPYIAAAQKAGCTTLREIAEALNAWGIRTARGGQWHAATVQRAMRRTV
jgi:DNA invertase Pin-like site-specific DNA recombinase